MHPAFDITLRGYDCGQVDELLGQAEQALGTGRWHEKKAALDALRTTTFRRRVRGYDRDQVDRVVRELGEQLS